MKPLPRHLLLSYLPQAAMFFFVPVTVKVLTNQLSMADYGSYCLINNLANYFMFIAGVGIHRYLGREVPGVSHRRQYSLFVRALAFELVVYVVLLVALICLITPLANAINLSDYKAVIIWFVAGYILYFVYNEILRFIGFQKRLGDKALLSTCEKPLLLVAIFLVIAFQGQLQLKSLFLMYIGVFFLLFVLAMRLLKPKQIRINRLDRFLPDVKGMVLFLPSFFLMDLMFKTKDVLPRYLLSSYDGTEAVGLYALADNLVRVFYLLVTPFIFILYPYIAEQFNIAKRRKLKESSARCQLLLRASYNLTIYSYLGLAIIVCIYGKEFILLLSKESYLPAFEYLPYFMINYLVVIFISISHPMLILLYDIKKLWPWYCAFLLLTVACPYILIAKLRFQGAILSVIAANLALAVFIGFLLKDYLKRLFVPRNALVLAAYLVLIAGAAFGARMYLDIHVAYKIAITSIIVAILFVVTRRRDIRVLFSPGPSIARTTMNDDTE